MQRRVAVIGASGYTGVELTRLLVAHPNVDVVVASSDRWGGETIEAKTGAPSKLRYESNQQALARATECDVVMFATPAEVSYDLVPTLFGKAPGVIDLSGAFRLRDKSLYPAFYKLDHAHPEPLRQAVYGLPELNRDAIRGSTARLVANPGCYATAIQLALAPFYVGARRIAGSGRVIVDAMSGVTGAGRKATEELSFAELAGDLRAYRVLRHQHQPEIEQGLADAIARGVERGAEPRRVEVTFVPHLLPVQRGILATCHIPVDDPLTESAARAVLEASYGTEPFISIAPSAEQVTLHDVVGTNKCRIGASVSPRGELVVTAAIDNLVKGAAGQAIQNMNLLLGLDETAGLAGLRGFFP